MRIALLLLVVFIFVKKLEGKVDDAATLLNVNDEEGDEEDEEDDDDAETEVAQGQPIQPIAIPSPPTLFSNATQMKGIPHVYGMRVQLPADNPFGYTSTGVCIVTPNEEFTVAIYGNLLDKIGHLYWTSTNNCSDYIKMLIPVNDFFFRQPHKVMFNLTLPLLPESVLAYKMCIQPNGGPVPDLPLEDVSTHITTERPPEPPKHYTLPLYLQLPFIAFLLMLSALFSGLTLGLMSLTPQELMLVCKCGTKEEVKYASKILPIRKKGNQLLCTLLLGNVIVNSAISILMDELAHGVIALALSTLGIVIFGEIIPQSICVKNGLKVGAHTIGVTQFFRFLTFPLAYPISRLLDKVLGEEYQPFDRKRLIEMVKMSMQDTGEMSNELRIAVGAMEIADKIVENVMTKLEDVFMVPDTTVLNAKMVAEIVKMGYTRIPVYANGDKNNVTDLLFVKDLALLDPDDCFTVKTVCGYHKHPVRFVMNDTPLPHLLEAFKKGEGHLAMVKKLVNDNEKDPEYILVGLVTLEDIVEEILQTEIIDETDVISDNVNRMKLKKEHPKDLTKYFGKEAEQVQISMQIQMVTLQWLVANDEAFTPKYIDTTVLERLIRNSARRVDISTLMAMTDDKVNVPRLAKLYTKDELSDKFILILEGRVQVTIGQGGMTFEAGPWHSFGNEILKKLVSSAATLGRSMSIVDTSDLSAKRPDLMFKPDYSVTIKDECTYLEISVTAYINAYKSTLMQRERSPANSRSPSPHRRSTLSEHSNSAEPVPIADPSAMIIPESGGRVSIGSAAEAARTLHLSPNNFKEVPKAEEEEMSLLSHRD